jgi:peptidoglycan/LPS O-acetylase OafA/YrhL
MRRVGQLAARTPPDRERYLDLLRAVAIIAVVYGHWLITAVEYAPDGRLVGRSALVDLAWGRPVDWLLQVIPIFFLVGGYANAASLTSRLRRGGTRVDWLLDRSGRLLPATTVLLVVLAAAAGLATTLGAEPDRVRTVVWLTTVPLWFLAAYLAVVALTPPLYALHRRFGLAVPATLLVLVALGDLVRLLAPARLEPLASGNFLFGWLLLHQLGFFWRDGRLPRRRRATLALLIGGLAATVLLTVVGPYPVSMINLPGEPLNNASPPTLALLATAAFHLGLALTLRDAGERVLRRGRRWAVVVAMNAVVLTTFLWHMVALVLLVGALAATGLLPTPPVGSAAWLLWRIPWLLALTLVLAVLIAIFGGVEVRRRRDPTHPATGRRWGRGLLTVAGYAAVVSGLLGNSLAESTSTRHPAGVPATALAGYLAGAALLWLLRTRGRTGRD